jgi:tetratricopeptide (TPR) repeat protein
LFGNGEYGESAALREEIKQFYSDLLGPEHAATTIMHWKAVTASKLKDASEAQQTAYMIAVGAKDQADQAVQNGQLKVGEQLYRRLVDAQTAVLGEAHPDVAVNLNDLGLILWRQQKYDQAEEFYLRSLKSREASVGKDLTYGTTMFNLGLVYQETERFDLAEKHYVAASEIEKEVLGPNSEAYLGTLRQLAALFVMTKDSEKLAAVEQQLSGDDPFVTVLSHLPSGTFAAAALEPAELTADPALQLLPFEVIEASGREELGFNPLDVEAVVTFATMPIMEPPFNFGVLFKLADGADAEFTWLDQMEPVDGQPYLREATGQPNPLCYVEFEDGVSLLGTEQTVRQCLTDVGSTIVREMLLEDHGQGQFVAAANLQVIRPILEAALQQTPPLPPVLEGLKSMPIETDTVRFRVSVGDNSEVTLILNSINEQTAERMAATISDGLQFAQQALAAEIAAGINDGDEVGQATQRYTERVMRLYMDRLQPTVEGSSVIISISNLEQAYAPVAVALLLPAIQAARQAARSAQDRNSLKQIGLAMHFHADEHKTFPARSNYDSNGKPLLSWRVHLLPYLDQQELYDQFRLDEPWDSDHNIALAEQMPDIYRSRRLDDATKTVFLTLDGAGTMMEAKTGIGFVGITDGASNTILVVEANAEEAVVWTKPQDLKFDEEDPGRGILNEAGTQVLIADGSVRSLPFDIDLETLRRLILRNDGEPVGSF